MTSSFIAVGRSRVDLHADLYTTACAQAGRRKELIAAQGSSELWQANVQRHLQMPERSIRKRGRKHAKESHGVSYWERDVVPFLTPVRVPPTRVTGPQRVGERRRPIPQGQAASAAAGSGGDTLVASPVDPSAGRGGLGGADPGEGISVGVAGAEG
eukprot:1351746-Amphidinium_carterae.1